MASLLTRADFDKICRTCLEFKEDMVSLFAEGVIEMLQDCTKIKVSTQDHFPNQLCTSCYEKIHEISVFQQKCIEFELLLHDIVETHQITECSQETKPYIETLTVFKTEPPVETMTVCKTEPPVPPDDNSDIDFDDSEFKDESDESLDGDFDIFTILPEDIEKKVRELDKMKCDPETLKCKVCDTVLEGKEMLVKHMERHENGLKCGVCGREFCDKNAFERHQKRHADVTRYDCQECAKTFDDITKLSQHMRKCHDLEPSLNCHQCIRKFHYQTHLDQHVEFVHTKKSYQCKICDKTFEFPFYLKQHLTTHITERLFACLLCDKRFKVIEALKSHNKRVHSERDQTVCSICGKSVKYLNAHLLKHREEKPFSCSYCPRSFQTRGLLNNHSRHTHELVKEKSFLCSVCAKQCTSRGELRIHVRTHTGEKPYQCELCEKSYKTKCALVTHMRSHTGERPYQCNVCDKGFFDTSSLKRHRLIHTGEKPYSCTICFRSFNQPSILKTHMKIHCSNTEKIEN